MKCQECGKEDDTVQDRACVYVDEIHNVTEIETVCDACEDEHAAEI